MTTKLFANVNSSHLRQELEASLRRALRGRNINLVILYQLWFRSEWRARNVPWVDWTSFLEVKESLQSSVHRTVGNSGAGKANTPRPPIMQLLLEWKWPTERSVWPNCWAELLLWCLAQMTELFSAEHRTFFLLHSMPMASFHIFVLLNDPHVRGL